MINKEGDELNLLGNVVTEYNIESKLKEKYSKTLNDEYNVKRSKINLFNQRSVLKIAAVILVLVTSVFVIRNNVNQTSKIEIAQLYLDETKVFGNAEITRKGISDQDQLRKKANEAFSKKDYQTSISLYKDMELNNQLSSLDQYYLGINYLRISKFHEAINTLAPLKDQDHFFSEEINWFLSLAYIITDQDHKATFILKQIEETNSYKHEQAKQLLNR